MVNHCRWNEIFGQRVIDAAWLCVYKCNLGILGKIDLPDWYQVDVQIAQHRSILGSADDSSERDDDFFLFVCLVDDKAQGRGAS